MINENPFDPLSLSFDDFKMVVNDFLDEHAVDIGLLEESPFVSLSVKHFRSFLLNMHGAYRIMRQHSDILSVQFYSSPNGQDGEVELVVFFKNKNGDLRDMKAYGDEFKQITKGAVDELMIEVQQTAKEYFPLMSLTYMQEGNKNKIGFLGDFCIVNWDQQFNDFTTKQSSPLKNFVAFVERKFLLDQINDTNFQPSKIYKM